MYKQLDQLAQLTTAIQFDFKSARISLASFRAVGLMADALYHPNLQAGVGMADDQEAGIPQ